MSRTISEAAGPSSSTISRSSQVLWMAVIMAIAIAARLHDVDSFGLWLDESLTITAANWSVSNLVPYPVDPTPGLYYLLHKLLIPSDASVLAVRSISLVAGVAAVPLIYALGRVAFGPRVGLFAAALLAVWPPHIVHSQDARAYSLLFTLTLCMSLGVVLYARAWLGGPQVSPRRRAAFLMLFAVTAALAFNTHMTSVFWVTGTSLLLVLAAALSGSRRAWIEVVATGVVLLALCGTALFRLSVSMTNADTFNWLPQATSPDFIRITLDVLAPPGPWGNGVAALKLAWRALALLLVGLAILAIWRARPVLSRKAIVPALIVIGYLLCAVAVWGVGFVGRPIFMERTILLCSVGAILVIALILDRSGSRLGAVLVVALVAGWGLGGPLMQNKMKEDWPLLAAELNSRVHPGDFILVCPAYDYPPLRYALRPAPGVRLGVIDWDDARPKLDAFQELETTVGADPHWDLAFHQQLEAPVAEHLLPRQLEEGPPQTTPSPVILRPGASIWEVKGGCDARQEAVLAAMIPRNVGAPVLVWKGDHRLGPGRLRLSRREVIQTATLGAAPRPAVPVENRGVTAP